MKKIVVKRHYLVAANADVDYTCYVHYPRTAIGGDGECVDLKDAYRFEINDFYILNGVYTNGKIQYDSDKDGTYIYNQELVEVEWTAKEYAIKCHRETNHKYDKNKPYEVHLQMVVDVAMKFQHLLPNDDIKDIIDACWCHDLIEDCRQTYNDVMNATNKTVAEIVYACTNEKGKNRAERGNDKYYEGIRNVKYASFVKLCDRIANCTYSKQNNSSQLGMYKKEHQHFISKFALNGLNDILIQHLNRIIMA